MRSEAKRVIPLRIMPYILHLSGTRAFRSVESRFNINANKFLLEELLVLSLVKQTLDRPTKL